LAEWKSVKRSSLKDVAIASIAINAFFVIFYLRRGDVCLVQGIVIGAIFPFVAFILEWRLHRIVLNDVWRKFDRPKDPVEQVIERMLTEASIPFEGQGPWQASKLFNYVFQQRYLLEDGSRITIRVKHEPTIYLGPVSMGPEVERLKGLVEKALDEP